jgi:adenylosuccinate synthase
MSRDPRPPGPGPRPGAGLAVVGAQWGDEGKGKVVDLLAGAADLVARFQGGPNAGHTVRAGGRTFQLHHVPSGILHPRTTCVIGNGVVILPPSFEDELRMLAGAGVAVAGRLFVSSRAHVILPCHLAADAACEDGGAAIGTTRRGVGPAYAAKVARRGVRVEDLGERGRLREVVARAVPAPEVESTVEGLLGFGERIRPLVADTVALVNRRLDEGARVLFEGAQGTLLDVDHGTYPYVTSSNSSAAGICAGLGVGPTRVERVLGVMKAYATRVGRGPMPTELTGEVGDRLRERGREYGTTTGRPRRCGWFDGVAGRHAVRVNRLDAVALTLLDVLDEFEAVRLCTGYRHGGGILEEMPLASWALAEVEPVYEELPGWRASTAGLRRFADLPAAARAYVARIEEVVGCEVALVSVGPGREQSMVRERSWVESWLPAGVRP